MRKIIASVVVSATLAAGIACRPAIALTAAAADQQDQIVKISEGAPAQTAGMDLSAMSFAELVALREQINLAIWQSEEWQEITVPPGVWKVGEDIPAGHWVIRPAPETYISVVYCDRLDEFGKAPGKGWKGWNGTLTAMTSGITVTEPKEVDLDMQDGMYFINRGDCIFTPYTGKPDLGFK